jgi:aryl-alcohol dehydrogenase-like predicted oxidoreductase
MGLVMKYTKLGKSGSWVSKICLGTASFGSGVPVSKIGHWDVVDEKGAFKIMDFALDAGINFFDTANTYGDIDTRGLSETIIGKWFKTGGNRRERTVIDGPNNQDGLSIYKICQHAENSLKNLQTEKVELYQIHKQDTKISRDEIWEAFEGLVRDDKVDYIDTSNHDAWILTKAQVVAVRRKFMGLVSEQHLYTPLNRVAEIEVLPCAMDQGIGVTILSLLFKGTLRSGLLNLGKHKLTEEVFSVHLFWILEICWVFGSREE